MIVQLSCDGHMTLEGLHIPETMHAVLYHPSSGQIYLAPGQDPSHSDDDITQYMQHSLLWPMASLLSSITFTSIQPLCFHPDLLPSKPTTCRHKHPWLIPMKISYHPCIVFTGPVLWTSKSLATQHNPIGRDWTSGCGCINLSMCWLPVAIF